MDQPNASIIRKAYQDFTQGNIPAVFAVFDPAITWHVPGHSPLSGDFTGHDQIGGFFKRTLDLSGGAFSIDVHNVLADGDLVVALTTVKARRNGVAASFPEVTCGASGTARRSRSASIRATSSTRIGSGPDPV